MIGKLFRENMMQARYFESLFTNFAGRSIAKPNSVRNTDIASRSNLFFSDGVFRKPLLVKNI